MSPRVLSRRAFPLAPRRTRGIAPPSLRKNLDRKHRTLASGSRPTEQLPPLQEDSEFLHLVDSKLLES